MADGQLDTNPRNYASSEGNPNPFKIRALGFSPNGQSLAAFEELKDDELSNKQI